jgi:hypothetical protein
MAQLARSAVTDQKASFPFGPFFCSPSTLQFCVTRDNRHLFPFAIRHSDFLMHSASNEGASAVLLVRSDLSKE